MATATFSQLVEFSLVNLATSPTEAVNYSWHDASEDEPILEQLDGLRSLSVSEDTPSVSKDGSTVTPPRSPQASASAKRSRGSDFDEDTLGKVGRIADETTTTPPKAPTANFATPEGVRTDAASFFVTPPTPPRLRTTSSSESPGLAARRAASGKLPNKALVSLQQMRFECCNAGMGLGVGPGSAGFEDMEGISPGPGMTFRLALGLTEKDKDKDTEGCSPGGKGLTPGEEENSFVLSSAMAMPSTLASPSHLRQSSPSSTRRLQFPRSPGSPSPIPDTQAVKIPPTLRGSKILDKLNLSSPPTLTSPLSPSMRDRSYLSSGPPSPLIQRTSAFNCYNTGPLTPLTPSHVPGAPNLDKVGAFDWSSYMMPDSPDAPLSPMRSLFHESGISPRQPFFLPTPPSDSGRPPLVRSQSSLVGSPLGDRSSYNPQNPFFARQ